MSFRASEFQKETYGRRRHETRTGTFDELAKNVFEAHERVCIRESNEPVVARVDTNDKDDGWDQRT